MSTRREVNQQRLALSQALREQCRLGQLIPGQPAPPIRQLATEFNISRGVANQVLQDLVSEGLFHVVPRVGTFVGRPKVANSEFYLMVLPDEKALTAIEDLAPIQQGFEERIAEKGSASIVMPLKKAVDLREAGQLPPLAGLFDMAYDPQSPVHWGATDNTPRVGFSGRIEDSVQSDEISFDDEGGGRLAASHLLELGHRTIAFLGLHSDSTRGNRTRDEMVWSYERETGWRQALEAHGVGTHDLAFHPPAALESRVQEHIRTGQELGRQILARPEITAVVAANDFVALGFLDAVRASGLPAARWPSVVGFDNRATINGHILTSLRLPFDQLGRAAADLLWERHHGKLSPPPVHRRVAMRLIPRLTSRRDGMQVMSGDLLTAA